MSLTLGEKLRQARQERGFTISEVAEQTRISSLYLESIENDDYSSLPGGIFNKGFLKSFAKFVGVNEQEALQDYSSMMSRPDAGQSEEPRTYRPQVLTDDRTGRSSIPTVIGAVVILGILTVAILSVRSYLIGTPAESVRDPSRSSPTPQAEVPVPGDTGSKSADVPAMDAIKVEFKALSQPVSLSATKDGRYSTDIVTPGTVVLFEPKQELKLSYSRSLAQTVQLSINGKDIKLPAQPLNARRAAIEIIINAETLPDIWKTGAIFADVPAANPDPNAAANTQVSAVPAPTPPRSASPKPTIAANTAGAPANTAAKPSTSPRPTPKNPGAITPPANRPPGN